MLTGHDESLMHQVGTTFDHAGVSDHRFFDRMWLGGHCADNVKLISGIAAYKNTNAFDGYFCVMKDGVQYNLRATRRFRPQLGELAVGPLSYEIVEPLRQVRVRLAPTAESPIAADILFTGRFPAYEEGRHFSRVNGAVLQDYMRYDQIGRLEGHIVVEGEQLAVDGWFGGRDHSWGTRLRMGGYDPDTFGVDVTEEAETDPARGNMLLWLGFDAGHVGGQLQRVEDGHGNLQMVSGHVFKQGDPRTYQVVAVEYEANFVAGTRVFCTATVRATLDNGERLDIAATALLSPWAYKGAGYDSGFDDERGLGLCRGDRVEIDRYDLADPERVVLGDGRCIRPAHREQPVTLTVNGRPGLGHMPLITRGHVARYELTRPATNKRGQSD